MFGITVLQRPLQLNLNCLRVFLQNIFIAGVEFYSKAIAGGIVRVNQAIQFPDREEWDENKKCVCFPALVNGMQLTCAISGESLAYRFTGDTPEQWLASFRQHRWDLEEEAENLIQEQSEDDQGWVWLP